MDNIKKIINSNNIKVKNWKLYEEAFTHKSFSNENRVNFNYQRLEFLGDAIIDFLVSDYLIKNTNLPEGKMSILRASSVKGEKLSEFAKELGFHECIRFGNSNIDFADNMKIYADVFESFVAALYLDQGIEEVKRFLKNNIFKFIDNSKEKEMKNPKTILQEYLQLESRGTIRYETIFLENKNSFQSIVFHDGNKFGTGIGKNKKESEVNAALNALELLKGGTNNEID